MSEQKALQQIADRIQFFMVHYTSEYDPYTLKRETVTAKNAQDAAEMFYVCNDRVIDVEALEGATP